jgi:putative ABC transport system permease protein
MSEPRRRTRTGPWRSDPRAAVDEELAFHLAERARLNEARGFSPERARSEAEQRFGDLERIRRACVAEHERSARRLALRERAADIGRDVRQAVRALMRARVYTFAAVLALALGVGANTAVFSVVSAVLLEPLPYADPANVVALHTRWDGTSEARLSPAEYLDIATQARGLSAVGVYARAFANVVEGETAERVPALVATPSVFDALGLAAAVGRLFTTDEGSAGAAPVAVLSYEYWQRRFGGAGATVGAELLLNGRRVTVVGVLPPQVRLPATYADREPPAVFVPLSIEPGGVVARGSHYLFGVARLASGVTVESANAEVGRLAQRMVAEYPDDYPEQMRFEAFVRPVHIDVAGDTRPLLLLLTGAVAMVLLIACANVSSLVLTRTEDRRREFAVRSALGAGRWGIARQLVIEQLVLATAAGALALILAGLALGGLLLLQPPGLPRLDEIGIDARALAFLALVSLAVTLLVTLAPLRLGAGGSAALRFAGARTTAGRASHQLRYALITAEVALCIVLLAGAGLLLRSFSNLMAVDPGYSTERVLTVPIALPIADYPDDAVRRRFFAELVAEAGALPGVVAAGAVANLPLAAGIGDLGIRIPDRPIAAGDVSDRLDWQVVTPGWLEAMGIELVRGRGITTADATDAPGAVVLSEAAARKYWPDRDPIGERFTLGADAGPGTVTVVGVARDIHQFTLTDVPQAIMYLPHAQFTFWNGGAAVASMTLVLQTAGSPVGALPPLRALVRRMDPHVPLGTVRTMAQVFGTAVAAPRFATSVLAGFALLALALAMIGIYGLVAYAVARRTREIAVRMALGAEPRAVVGGIVRQGMTPVLIGVAAGGVAALALARSLEGMLFGVAPTDGVTLAGALLVLTGTALVACVLPARRATRIAPLAALRDE